MDQIARLTGPRPVNTRTEPKRPGQGFSVGPHCQPATTSSAQAMDSAELPALLCIQEHDGDDPKDRGAKRRGRDLLRALAELQRTLLSAAGEAAALDRLGELASTPADASDPRLAHILAAIVLRARVEMARRTPGGGNCFGPTS